MTKYQAQRVGARAVPLHPHNHLLTGSMNRVHCTRKKSEARARIGAPSLLHFGEQAQWLVAILFRFGLFLPGLFGLGLFAFLFPILTLIGSLNGAASGRGGSGRLIISPYQT